jgi:hypothetical protein
MVISAKLWVLPKIVRPINHVFGLYKHFLDHEANLVDEDRVVQELDDASDYERGVERLNEKDKSVWRKLLELGGSAQKAITAAATVPSKKQKRMLSVVACCLMLNDGDQRW